jgi:hypothetical protein
MQFTFWDLLQPLGSGSHDCGVKYERSRPEVRELGCTGETVATEAVKDVMFLISGRSKLSAGLILNRCLLVLVVCKIMLREKRFKSTRIWFVGGSENF